MRFGVQLDMRLTHDITAVLAAVLAGTAIAGPLDRAVVDKDARWVVHIDAEAILASTPGQVIREVVDRPEFVVRVRTKEQLGFDPISAVKGVTVYGCSFNDGDGVAVLTTTGVTESLDAHLAGAGLPGYASESVDGVTIHTWTHEGQTFHAACVRAAGPGDDRRVLFAGGREQLERALRVLRTTLPSQQTSPPAGVLAASPHASAMLFAVADGVGEHAKPNAALIRDVSSVVIQTYEAMGDGGPSIVGTLELTTGAEKRASDIQQFFQGMLALARIQGENDPAMKPLVDAASGVSVKVEGKRVLVESRHSSATAIQLLRELEKEAVKAVESHQKKDAPPADAPKAGGK